MTNLKIDLANRIASAIDGLHTAPGGDHGHHWIISARAWSAGNKARVYVDRRFVNGRDGSIDRRVDGNGYIDLLSTTDLVYAVREGEDEMRTAVAAL